MGNLAHLFATRVPVDPATFGGRLEAAGFSEAVTERQGRYPVFRFRPRKAA